MKLKASFPSKPLKPSKPKQRMTCPRRAARQTSQGSDPHSREVPSQPLDEPLGTSSDCSPSTDAFGKAEDRYHEDNPTPDGPRQIVSAGINVLLATMATLDCGRKAEVQDLLSAASSLEMVGRG